MFKIKRSLDVAMLRGMCIKHDYYTRGSNADYGEMLFKFQNFDITETELEWLATNIKSHSNTYDEVITIAYNILTEACYEYLEQ